MDQLPALARIRATYDAEVKPSERRFFAAALVASLFGGALVARLGTPAARVAAAVTTGLVILVLVLRAIVSARRRRSARRIVESTVAAIDPALASATLRAMRLVDRTEIDRTAGSLELAELHLSRLVARTSMDRLLDRADAIARRWSMVALAIAAGTTALVAVEPFRVLEGLDVAVARQDKAPLDLLWLDDVEVTATPPDYLHAAGDMVPAFVATSQPRGTTLAFRGRPVRDGRALVVTDGKKRVGFVDDGAGNLVARWVVGDSADLHVAAAFGDVVIEQADVQEVDSIADQAPVVKVEGAPRTVKLLDEPSVAIHYEATDDHGLREIDLVLRAGSKEERRVLSRPEGTVDRGGYELRFNDAFFKRVYVPVEVRVEARDNDLVSGPKWGKSAAIVVVPPQVGEPEALRYQALVKARDALTDLAGDRIDLGAPLPKDVVKHKKAESDAHAKAVAVVEEVIDAKYGGLGVRGRIAKIARGQLRKLHEALAAEEKAEGAVSHDKLVEVTNGVLLAFDSGVRGLGERDTVLVSKRLADVADDVANGEQAIRQGADEKSVDARVEASIGVLDSGGRQMLKLGELGLDLGEIVAADLRRVARARDAADVFHAELAARDLAARLRDASPSFSGGGGGGHGGGVESGGAPTPDLDQASDAEQQQAAQDRDLEELVKDHADAEQDVADALDRASAPEDIDALRQEMKEHAESLREAVKDLPKSEGDPSTAEGSASAGREQAEAMAAELERGSPRGAVKSGKEAKESLELAQKRAADAEGFFPEERAGREAGKAKEALERELAWAEAQLEKLRKSASKRAKNDLDQAGKSEDKLAERAKKLAEKGDSGDRSMPEDQLERLEQAEQKMRDAQRALGQGDGEDGLKQQDEAQRLLEMARGERDESGGPGNKDGDGRDMARKTEIPGKNEHKGPEEFRKRVMKGLGGSSDPILRDAVKRYAEGLLK